MRAKPFLVIIALGANDGLRGFDVKATQENLEKMIVYLKKNSVKVVLAGMKVPPNYGQEYRVQFSKMWQGLAAKHQVKLIPFLLAGVAGEKSMNQEDGIHPNSKGHLRIADVVFKAIEELL